MSKKSQLYDKSNYNFPLPDKKESTGKILFSTQSSNIFLDKGKENVDSNVLVFGTGVHFGLEDSKGMRDNSPYVSEMLVDDFPVQSKGMHLVESTNLGDDSVESNQENKIHTQDKDTEVDGDKRKAGSKLPLICEIKSCADKVNPVDPNQLFKKETIQSRELNDSCESIFENYLNLLDLVPRSSRQEHFIKVDAWQAVPHLMNLDFGTNLMNADAARFYEAFVMTSILLPAAMESSNNVSYNILYLCPPSGGAVAGTKLFFNLNYPHLNINWRVFSRHPWKESSDLNLVVPQDSVLFLETSRWKFVLDDEIAILTTEKVRDLVWEVRISDTQMMDLVVADLSPSLIDIDSAANGIELVQQMKKALITEASQLEIALRILKEGGNLIMSVVNPVDQFSTIGNLTLLCELFSTVDIVFTHPSSACLRPAMITCSGYVGIERLQTLFPDFTSTYLRLIIENINSGKKVLMDTADMDPLIRSRLVAMGQLWADEEVPRLHSLASSFNSTLNPSYQWREQQLEVAARWMDLVNGYVKPAVPKWNMNIDVPLPCTVKELQDLIALEMMELEVLDEDNGSIDSIVSRLSSTYINLDTAMSECPDLLFVNFNELQLKTQKLDAVVREAMPNLMLFSRFIPLHLTYDFVIARRVGAKFPISNYAVRIKSGIQQTCSTHFKPILLNTLNGNGFSLNVQEKRLAVACVNFPTSARIKMSDGVFHQRVFSNILEQLSDPKLLDRNDNLFVCMLPLTSRLLIGIVCLINKCFKKRTSLVVCKEDRIMGVLFQEFRGQKHNDVLWAKTILSTVICDLENGRNVDMEIVSLPSLLTCIDLKSLFTYNSAVVGRTIATTVNVLLSALTKSHEIGYLFNQ